MFNYHDTCANVRARRGQSLYKKGSENVKLSCQAFMLIVSLNDKACNAVRSGAPVPSKNAWENICTTVRHLVPITATRI